MDKDDIELWICEYVVNDESRFRVGLGGIGDSDPEFFDAISLEEKSTALELVSELEGDLDAEKITSYVSDKMMKADLGCLSDLTYLRIALELVQAWKGGREVDSWKKEVK